MNDSSCCCSEIKFSDVLTFVKYSCKNCSLQGLLQVVLQSVLQYLFTAVNSPVSIILVLQSVTGSHGAQA